MRKYMINGEDGPVEIKNLQNGCWINIECPDDDDLRFIMKDLKIPEDFIISIADVDERPRVERDDDWALTILRIPIPDADNSCPYFTVPLGIIQNDEYVVTITSKRTELISDFIDHARKRHIKIHNHPDFLLRMIFSSTFWFLNYLKEINSSLALAENSLKKSIRNNDLLDIMRLQKSLVFFNTSLQGNEVLLNHLKRLYYHDFDPELLEDVEIELSQADNTVKVYGDILNSTLDTYSSVISNNVNDIMKKMTGISIVLMIPTLVASFYGMNVDVPLAGWKLGFWAIVAGSFLLTAIIYIFLRRSRWF